MKDIQKRELIRSIKLIESLGCSFRIITPDGESFGELKVVEPKPPRIRAERRYPYGSLTKYIKEHVDLNASVGSVQEIFCTEFDVESLRSCACNILTSTWGKDTYVTVGYPDRFEIMRTGDESAIEEAV